MDDRTFWIIVSIVASSVFALLLAGILKFDVPAGFWGVLGGIVTALTAIIARKGGGSNGG